MSLYEILKEEPEIVAVICGTVLLFLTGTESFNKMHFKRFIGLTELISSI